MVIDDNSPDPGNSAMDRMTDDLKAAASAGVRYGQEQRAKAEAAGEFPRFDLEQLFRAYLDVCGWDCDTLDGYRVAISAAINVCGRDDAERKRLRSDVATEIMKVLDLTPETAPH